MRDNSGHNGIRPAVLDGETPGRYAERVKSTAELAEVAEECAEFRVYVVVVCQTCGWNQLVGSLVLGKGSHRPPAPTAERPLLVNRRRAGGVGRYSDLARLSRFVPAGPSHS